MPTKLDTITALIGRNHLNSALVKLKKHVIRHKKDFEAHRLLGVVYLQKQNLPLAEKQLFKAQQLNPNHQPTLINIASLYKAQKKYNQAHACIQQIIASTTNNFTAYYNLGNLYRDQGNLEKAKSAFEQTLTLESNHMGALVAMGFVTKNLGEIDLSIDYFHRALAINPFQYEIYWALANLKSYRFSSEEQATIDQMLIKESDKAPTELLFTKAYMLEQDELYDEAFQQLLRANSHKYKQLKRKAFDWSTFTHDIKRIFNAEFIAQYTTQQKHQSRPVFIVGMPRSGSTLTEQILASHSSVFGAAELAHFPKLITDIGTVKSLNYPLSFANIDSDTFTHMGQKYLEVATAGFNESLFTDKQPLNFNFVGAILMAIPEAKVIHCTRQDLAVLLSCYKQLFAYGHEYSYDIKELVGNFQHQENIMAYWKSCFPEQIHTVKYENMVSNTKQEISQLLGFLQLEWQQSCLHFYQTKRSIKTASAGQVTQKIYSSSIDLHNKYINSMHFFTNLLNNC